LKRILFALEVSGLDVRFGERERKIFAEISGI